MILPGCGDTRTNRITVLQHPMGHDVPPRVRSALRAATHILCPLLVAASTHTSINNFIEWRRSLAAILVHLQVTLASATEKYAALQARLLGSCMTVSACGCVSHSPA
jgi:hypothetical protein